MIERYCVQAVSGVFGGPCSGLADRAGVRNARLRRFGAGRLQDELLQSRLDGPTAMAFAPDGRIFVAEQRGTLRVVGKGGGLRTVKRFGRVDSRGERGLVGVDVDPNFSKNKYVYYTKKGNRSQNRIARVKVDRNRAKPGSLRTLFRLPCLGSATNHNGGAPNFGRDGKLYVAVGDNSRKETPQKLNSLFGKMLRLNPNGSIPWDNPFYNRTKGKAKAVWTRGLRNPFSFAVQPGSGKMFIKDVGGKIWEEINRGKPRGNYGWPRYEGPERDRRFDSPFYAYRHDGRKARTGCAITGVTFYNPDNRRFPRSYVGDYFFADFCNGWVRTIGPKASRSKGFASGFNRPVDLDVGPNGNLYVLERGSGTIEKVRYAR